MNIEELREYCLSKPYSDEYFPFDQSTLAFKVFDKIFGLINIDASHPMINLKCDPEKALQWREEFLQVKPGYHMNKKHWNTVDFTDMDDGRIIMEMIDHSYECVVKKMPVFKQKLIAEI